jgi:hypothetical protein
MTIRMSLTTRSTGTPASAGMSTSSITCVKNVALARISTSRNRDDDWVTILSRASRRWTRHGENGSATGTANSTRQGIVRAHRVTRPTKLAGLRPTTWSRVSIAASSGSRCAAVQG